MRRKVMEGTKIKRRKMKGDRKAAAKRDSLAELPEPLLHHILSYLTMKDVIRTCVLAKRWRFIWLYVPCLTFSPLKISRSIEEAFINQTLILHKGPRVQKFNLTLNYSTEARLVHSWIQFALSRNVNQLYLYFGRYHANTIRYTILDTIFCCSSLAVLTLAGCRIELPDNIKLDSLRTLSFEEVDFDGGAINNLLSSCSVLEDLSFTDCHWKNNPDLVIMNSRVKTLNIQGGIFYKNSTLEINAPFIVSFELIKDGFLLSKKYVIKRMGSLCSAGFVCSKSDACYKRTYTRFGNLENLENLCHVKDLRMCSCYIQAMFGTKNPTQDCRQTHIMDFISFDATCLRIKTGLMKWELPGIAYILSHSPGVETLIISFDEIEEEEINDNVQEEEYWKLQEPKFVNLKKVKICNFMKNLSLLESKRSNMNFLRFLVKNSTVMERMTITVDFGGKSENKKLKLLSKLTQELLAFPRASLAAQISFN